MSQELVLVRQELKTIKSLQVGGHFERSILIGADCCSSVIE